ncbi:MAG: hypothetical protein HGB11_10305 [Chlorobiales bacterium]|nr:hypothetical protein [Chlorobiales bacterium]
MLFLIAYIILGCAWLWAAYDVSDGTISSFLMNVACLILGAFLFLGIGKVVDFFFDGLLGGFCNVMSALFDGKEVVRESGYGDDEMIEHVDGEVVGEETYPALCAKNPTSAKRIANEKTYFGGGGVFFANWMWCDVCRHTSLHSYIDGAWVCQAPTHH